MGKGLGLDKIPRCDSPDSGCLGESGNLKITCYAFCWLQKPLHMRANDKTKALSLHAIDLPRRSLLVWIALLLDGTIDKQHVD
jgi:hypothetical protein